MYPGGAGGAGEYCAGTLLPGWVYRPCSSSPGCGIGLPAGMQAVLRQLVVRSDHQLSLSPPFAAGSTSRCLFSCFPGIRVGTIFHLFKAEPYSGCCRSVGRASGPGLPAGSLRRPPCTLAERMSCFSSFYSAERMSDADRTAGHLPGCPGASLSCQSRGCPSTIRSIRPMRQMIREASPDPTDESKQTRGDPGG